MAFTVQFELTEEDLFRLQVQTVMRRRQRMLRLQRSPAYFAVVVALAGALVWPLWVRAFPLTCATQRQQDARLLLYLGVLLAAAGAAWILSRLMLRRPAQLRRLTLWSARRMARTAARRSVLGPTSVTLEPDALVRTNASGARRLAWSEIGEVLASPEILSLRIRGENRIVVIPSRAFPDQPAADRFRALVEMAAGRQAIDVPL
jgi:hypothetical protein